jgi:GAF domain-containing protein
MAESLVLTENVDRATTYREIAPQIASLIGGETDLVANLANIAAVLKEALRFFWDGFYLREGEELVLGPCQGPVACTRIAVGSGVCGTAFAQKRTLIVPDVDAFPGHIACSSLARSEIVVPVFDSDGNAFGVLDIDSDALDDFNDIDRTALEEIVRLIPSARV